MEGVKTEIRDVKEEASNVKTEGLADVKAETVPEKSAILGRLREILATVNLDETTEKMLRVKLEAEFYADLAHLKSDIRKEIEAYLDEHAAAAEEVEDEQPLEKKKKASGGFSKPIKLSPALAAIIGSESESRSQVVKKLWVHIKENNLQNPADRRTIMLDDKLKTIFSGKTTMFSMNTQLCRHFLTEEDGQAPSKSKKKSRDEDDDDDEEDEQEAKPKRPKKVAASKSRGGGGSSANNAFTRDYKLAPELAELTGTPEMSRPNLTKFFNVYFKEHGLLNPENRSIVLCNDKLKGIFQVDSFKSFGELQKLLSPHLLK